MIWKQTLIWSLSKINTSVCAQTWWAAYISSVAADVFVHCSDALPIVRGELVCCHPFAWVFAPIPKTRQEKHTGYLSGDAASPRIAHCPFLSPSSHTYYCHQWFLQLCYLSVAKDLARFQANQPNSNWVPAAPCFIKPPFFNTFQDCSLRNIMVNMDISCQEEDPANTFCMYVSQFIYCNMRLGALLNFYIFQHFLVENIFLDKIFILLATVSPHQDAPLLWWTVQDKFSLATSGHLADSVGSWIGSSSVAAGPFR